MEMDNTKIDLNEVESEHLDWINQVQDDPVAGSCERDVMNKVSEKTVCPLANQHATNLRNLILEK
jgi:hypothetical protein